MVSARCNGWAHGPMLSCLAQSADRAISKIHSSATSCRARHHCKPVHGSPAVASCASMSVALPSKTTSVSLGVVSAFPTAPSPAARRSCSPPS
eukprot:8493818-Pyramimonas_sp.AAC.1